MRWIWPLTWAGLIFASSTRVITAGELSHTVSRVSLGHVSDSSFRNLWLAVWWILVKGWHAVEFGVLFLLVRRAVARKAVVWSVALPVIYAICDEAHQLFVPHRGCRASDVCIDCLGILAAWALTQKFNRKAFFTTGAAVWILSLYLLSVHPFGTVTLPVANHTPAAFAP